MAQNTGTIRKQVIWIGILLAIALLLKLTSVFPDFIEGQYLPSIYLPLASGMRVVFGWLPFSVGDILYGFIFGLTFYYLYRLGLRIYTKQLTRGHMQYALLRLGRFLLSLYIYFNIAWGLNYNRLGIAYQLKLEPQEYTKIDLLNITSQLITKVNTSRSKFADSILILPKARQIFNTSAAAYEQVVNVYPFLQYTYASVKTSYFGRLGNYLGFLGYYNPFTGEAQVNMTIPRFMVPAVTCHEIAHQLGYASESEANFVGYLAAAQSDEEIFRYSSYFELFRYANNELARMDTSAAKQNITRLNDRVKGDIDQIKDFAKRTENPLEPFIRGFYDYYLKANQQERGLRSYNEVVGWLIAFQKKYGYI